MKILIGILTGEYARRADFYDYFNLMSKPSDVLCLMCHDRSPARGRNIIVEQALLNNCTHILFIDDDMAYKPGALNQLLEHDQDIVSGLYFSRMYPFQPLIFDAIEEKGFRTRFLHGDEPRLLKIVGAGMGFCLVKMSVFQRMEKPWFRLGELDSEHWCDDTGFFKRANEAGINVYCDTECRIGHMGTQVVWPVRDGDKWFSGMESGSGKLLKTPQLVPEVV